MTRPSEALAADRLVNLADMGYPEKLLSEGEVIERQFRPHWSRLLGEGLVVLAGILLAVLVAVLGWPVWLYAVIAVIAVALITNGVVKWLTTWHVVTNERVIYRAGFVAKVGKEIPLEVINDVAFNQTVFERVLGTGDLLIESAGTHGQTRYSDIPGPEEVQSVIYKVREDRMAQMRRGEVMPNTPGGGSSRVTELEALARLHDQGKLSDEEFEAEKRRILGGGS